VSEGRWHVSNTASSVLPTLLTSTATITITIKYPTQTYTQSSYNYKKDGFLKYIAGNQSSALTRDTGVCQITDFDTIITLNPWITSGINIYNNNGNVSIGTIDVSTVT
jgi:hypothetical protein